MPVLKLDDAEIHYQEFGSGYPIVVFAPGGMKSRMSMWTAELSPSGAPRSWHNWPALLSDKHRVIAMDQRNAGDSSGAIEADHGWHTYTSDHLALMDHLGIEICHVMGVCIGPSFFMHLLKTAPERVNALVVQNPIGVHPDFPTYFQDGFVEWADDLCANRPDLDREKARAFGENMWSGDFVFSVDRDFVRNIDRPAIVLPGDDKPHPAVIGVEVADILPGAERLMHWKGPEHFDAQLDRVTGFLANNTPH